jgi:small GTP-binding protein
MSDPAIGNEARLPEFKVVLVGDTGVGKTSIVIRYNQGKFLEDQPSTIGSAFIRRPVGDESNRMMLSLWDTAGQERYRSLVPAYSRGSRVAIIVFDVSDSATFDGLDEWITHIQTHVPSCQIVFAGSKCDLHCPSGERDRYEQWAGRNGYPLLFVSAKTGEGVTELFNFVIDGVLKTLSQQPVGVGLEEATGKNIDGSPCC